MELLLVAIFVALAVLNDAISIPSSSVQFVKGPATNYTKRIATSSSGRKRGIAYVEPRFTGMFSNSKVSWMYNWGHSPGNAAGGFEYVPMLWSNREQTEGWHYDLGNLMEHGNTQHLLGFNEPDNCGGGGSCMPDPRGTALAYKAWLTILKEHNDHAGHDFWLGSPSITIGKRAPNGLKMGLDWLRDFLVYCSNCRIDFIAVHWYDQAWNTDYFKNYINEACEVANGRYIWVTEFSPTDGDETTRIEFLKQVLPFLDSSHCVEKYAMFMAEPGRLIRSDGSGLSALGNFYATF